MAYSYACTCPACRVRAVHFPLLLIGAGVLFSLDLIWQWWPISKTWPALLVLWGFSRMVERLTPDTGHGQPPPRDSLFPPPETPPLGAHDAS